jgi:hypothetical protein
MDAQPNDGGVGDVLGQSGQEINEDAFERVDALALEIFPSLADERLPEWETALALTHSRMVSYGSVEQRQAQIVACLRENGASTKANIKAALTVVTGNAAAITIVEHTRAAMDSANEYTFGAGAAVNPGANQWLIVAGDNAPCSDAGARLYLNVSGITAAEFSVTLTAPDTTSTTWAAGVIPTGGAIVWWPGAANKDINGTWTVDIASTAAGAGSLGGAGAWLLVEGIGRIGLTDVEGLGANIFEWAALIDTSLAVASLYDQVLAREIVNRWNPAHARGYLAQYNGLGGAVCIFDDALTPFDMGLFA